MMKQKKGTVRRNAVSTMLIVLFVVSLARSLKKSHSMDSRVSMLLPEDGAISQSLRHESTGCMRKQCLRLLRHVPDDLCDDEIDEHSSDWVLENSPYGYGNVSVRVPGVRGRGMVVHSLLHELGVIDDPSSGRNELIDSWVRDDVWTFHTEFKWRYGQKGAVLELDRVDTVSDVYIDGILVGRTSSMHRRYRMKVSLELGVHTLAITLHPVKNYTEKAEKALLYPMPHTQHDVHVGHYNLVRKVAADFGWDFAPAFAPCGLLGSIWLQATGVHGWQMEQLVLEQEHKLVKNTVVLHSHVFFSSYYATYGTIHVAVQSPAGVVVGSAVVENPMCEKYCTHDGMDIKDADVTSAECFWKCRGPSIVLENPELWWTWDQYPDDGGKGQPLYSVTATARCGSDCFSKKMVSIGLRVFELIRDPIQDDEESFYFRLNGRMVYSKGSNLVPLHIFADKTNVQDIIDVIWSAKRAHFNTIRVWGGGGYLPDVFFEECDKQGILVWQEFMFACATYPTDAAFQMDVAAEVHQQSLRIINHPSVVLFGFNNENENSFDWFEETIKNNALYSVDYYALFIETVRKTLRRVDPTVVYVDTSPSNGIYSEDPVYTKRWGDVMDERRGDVHFYDYASNLLSSDVFPKAKFISEFGVLSLPSWNIYSRYIEVEDMENPRGMMEFRTRRKNGLQELFQQMKLHFLPSVQGSNALDIITKHNIRHLIYLSQLQQGLIYRNAAFHWRKSMDPKQTMGFLYWQLQDVGGWSGPSWSGLNSDGSWKLLHYFARDFFAPLTLYIEKQRNIVRVYVSNHKRTDVEATVVVNSIPYSATQASEMRQHCHLAIVTKTLGYRQVCNFQMDNDTSKKEFIVGSIYHSQGAYPHSIVFLPSEAAEAHLQPSTITIDSIDLSGTYTRDDCPPKYDKVFSMQVSAALTPALYVSFESEKAIHFVQNAVHILPWDSKTIQGCHHSSEIMNATYLRDTIQIFDLQSAITIGNDKGT